MSDLATSAASGRVLVVGSANLDTFLRVERMPRPGETVRGTGVFTAVGGKGVNQAIAAARTGSPAAFVGAVGEDAEGERVLGVLAAAGVDVSGVVRSSTPTGRATILLDEAGENSIILTPGANAEVALPRRLPEAAVLVVQGELPASVSIAALAAAAEAGMRAIVNLAPVLDLGGAERVGDPLVLNEVEAEQLLGVRVDGGDAEALERVRAHARSTVVTLGAAGALIVERDRVTPVPAPPPARVVDTTGAGDAFVGVLAAALARGADLVAATGAAVAAATASVEVLGAGESYPAFALDG